VFVDILKHDSARLKNNVNFESFGLSESLKKCDGSGQNNTINENGVALSDPESPSKADSTELSCHHDGEQDEVEGKFICI
jgi:hypothetical protein